MADQQKILVTGANGQLGMELKDLATNYSEFEFLFAAREELPVDDFVAVRAFFEKRKPHYCINCAAYTKVDAAESHKDEAFLINAGAVSVIADLCHQFKTHLVHISTDYVFNGTVHEPHTEESPTDPISIYGASKLAGEQYASEMNPETIIIRTSWVYSQYGNNFVKTMIRLMKEKSEINVVNDQFGSPTYAADLADGIMKIITMLKKAGGEWPGGIYNFSNEGVISWYDFAKAIAGIINSNCVVRPIPTSAYPTPAQRPMFSVLDKRKIQQVFGIELKNWKDSLAVCMDKLLSY